MPDLNPEVTYTPQLAVPNDTAAPRFVLFNADPKSQDYAVTVLRDHETGTDYPFSNIDAARTAIFMLRNSEAGFVGSPIDVAAYGNPDFGGYTETWES